MICFEDFVPDMEGKLNSSQLDQLSDLLKLFFYFEDECTNSIVNDIRVISRRINTTSESELIHHYRYCRCTFNSMVAVKGTMSRGNLTLPSRQQEFVQVFSLDSCL